MGRVLSCVWFAATFSVGAPSWSLLSSWTLLLQAHATTKPRGPWWVWEEPKRKQSRSSILRIWWDLAASRTADIPTSTQTSTSASMKKVMCCNHVFTFRSLGLWLRGCFITTPSPLLCVLRVDLDITTFHLSSLDLSLHGTSFLDYPFHSMSLVMGSFLRTCILSCLTNKVTYRFVTRIPVSLRYLQLLIYVATFRARALSIRHGTCSHWAAPSALIPLRYIEQLFPGFVVLLLKRLHFFCQHFEIHLLIVEILQPIGPYVLLKGIRLQLSTTCEAVGYET